ncbi:MAG: hypothetical protein WC499_00600 [Patescibacteria group bacterium]
MKNLKNEYPKKLGELQGVKLNGWRIVKGGLIEKKHGMGSFLPALVKLNGHKSHEPFFCADCSLFPEVLKKLPKTRNEIKELPLLVSPDSKQAISLEYLSISNPDWGERPVMTVLSKEDIAKLENSAFRWA